MLARLNGYSTSIIILLLCLTMAGIIVGIAMDTWWITCLIPSAILGLYLLFYDLRLLYGLLFLTIPLSAELELAGGLSTDLLGEPILWVLTVLAACYILTQGISKQLFSWLTALVLAHLAWVFVSALFAEHMIIGLKYALAKTWYILPFYALPQYLLGESSDIRYVLKCFLVGTMAAALYYFVQHWQTDLSFLSRTNAGQPIWRNHVNYACTLVLNLPIVWYLYKTSDHPDRWIYPLVGVILCIFMFFAYARIVYIAIVVTLLYYLVLRWKLTRPTLLIMIASAIFSVACLTHDNRYLELAPVYEQAITQGDFTSKISATTQGTDISTMERLHRWVAGGHMISDHPWTGVGPGNFYSVYKPYTVYSFETYVSDNPERSGIHSHYIMVWVEQGYIGILIWVSLLIAALLMIERKYHQSDEQQTIHLVFAAAILVMIMTINLVNDMVEVIKVGGLFFFALFLMQREEEEHEQLVLD